MLCIKVLSPPCNNTIVLKNFNQLNFGKENHTSYYSVRLLTFQIGESKNRRSEEIQCTKHELCIANPAIYRKPKPFAIIKLSVIKNLQKIILKRRQSYHNIEIECVIFSFSLLLSMIRFYQEIVRIHQCKQYQAD